jgi:hypothetical protein
MSALALGRLLARPAMLFWLFTLLSSTLMLVELAGAVRGVRFPMDALISAGRSPASADALYLLHFTLVVLSGLVGFLAGQAAREVQHAYFAWAVPGLRRDLGRGVAAVGGLCAIGVAVGYALLDGPLAPAAAGALALVAFALGSAVEGVTLFMAFRLRALLPVLALGALAFGIDAPARWAAAQPIPFGIAAVAFAAVILYRVNADDAVRARIFTPTYSLLNSFSAGAKRCFAQEIASARATGGGLWGKRLWSSDPLRDDTAAWVRASTYERYGSRTWRYLSEVAALAVVSVVLVGIFTFQEGFANQSSRRDGCAFVYRSIFAGRGEDYTGMPPLHWLTAWVIAAFAWGRSANWALFPRWGRFYPLSRASLARVAFWTSFEQNAGHCVVTGLGFAAGGLAAAAFAGEHVVLTGIPVFARALGLAFALLPLQQMLRLRYARQAEMGRTSSYAFLTIALSFAFSTVVTLWTVGYPRTLRGLPPLAEAAILVVLALGFQLFYQSRLRAHFARADLA